MANFITRFIKRIARERFEEIKASRAINALRWTYKNFGAILSTSAGLFVLAQIPAFITISIFSASNSMAIGTNTIPIANTLIPNILPWLNITSAMGSLQTIVIASIATVSLKRGLADIIANKLSKLQPSSIKSPLLKYPAHMIGLSRKFYNSIVSYPQSIKIKKRGFPYLVSYKAAAYLPGLVLKIIPAIPRVIFFTPASISNPILRLIAYIPAFVLTGLAASFALSTTITASSYLITAPIIAPALTSLSSLAISAGSPLLLALKTLAIGAGNTLVEIGNIATSPITKNLVAQIIFGLSIGIAATPIAQRALKLIANSPLMSKLAQIPGTRVIGKIANFIINSKWITPIFASLLIGYFTPVTFIANVTKTITTPTLLAAQTIYGLSIGLIAIPLAQKALKFLANSPLIKDIESILNRIPGVNHITSFIGKELNLIINSKWKTSIIATLIAGYLAPASSIAGITNSILNPISSGIATVKNILALSPAAAAINAVGISTITYMALAPVVTLVLGAGLFAKRMINNIEIDGSSITTKNTLTIGGITAVTTLAAASYSLAILPLYGVIAAVGLAAYKTNKPYIKYPLYAGLTIVASASAMAISSPVLGIAAAIPGVAFIKPVVQNSFTGIRAGLSMVFTPIINKIVGRNPGRVAQAIVAAQPVAQPVAQPQAAQPRAEPRDAALTAALDRVGRERNRGVPLNRRRHLLRTTIIYR